MLILYAYLLGHFALRQMELHRAIRLAVSFYYNKGENIIHDV